MTAIERAYFDASATVKLVLKHEQGADIAAALWRDTQAAYTSWLSYPEAHSALARAHRNDPLSLPEPEDAADLLDMLWTWFVRIDLTPAIAQRAAGLVSQYPLSGADAVHIATALSIRTDTPLSFASWDRRQAAAAAELGLIVLPALI